MTAKLDLAVAMAESGKVLGALSLLMRPSLANAEEHIVTADLLLGRLSVEDFENWARFKMLLLGQFDELVAAPHIDPARLLDRWVVSVREGGLGVASPLFLHRLREGLAATSHSAARSVAGAALVLLESEGQMSSSVLDSFGLTSPDAFLLMKHFQQSGRSQAARMLAELRLRRGNCIGLGDYFWYSQILVSLGHHDAAFEAQFQFARLALQEMNLNLARNGVAKAMRLIPFCREMNALVVKLRELMSGRLEFDEEFHRLEKLIDDIEAFRSQTHASKTISVGRHYYREADLHDLEDSLQRELRLKPSPVVYYELSKIAALHGDVMSSRELLLTASGLDARFFGQVRQHA